MYRVQCEGYKSNGERCGYHGMAAVSSGMFCHFHRGQSDYRTYRARCLCRNCTNRTTFYFEDDDVEFYCQTHQHMAPRGSYHVREPSDDDETSEDSYGYDDREPTTYAYAQTYEYRRPALAQSQYRGGGGGGYGGGGYGGGRDLVASRGGGAAMRASTHHVHGGGYNRGGGGGGNVYVNNYHVHHHYPRPRNECSIQ